MQGQYFASNKLRDRAFSDVELKSLCLSVYCWQNIALHLKPFLAPGKKKAFSFEGSLLLLSCSTLLTAFEMSRIHTSALFSHLLFSFSSSRGSQCLAWMRFNTKMHSGILERH